MFFKIPPLIEIWPRRITVQKLLSSKDFDCVIVSFSSWKELIGRLRYQVFVEDLGWVKGSPETKTETDEYDSSADHLAVFNKNDPKSILCYMRILPATSSGGMMLTDIKCFHDLLPRDFVVPPLSIELSRLCLDPKLKGTRDGLKVTSLLFKSVLKYMEERGLNILFAIADAKDARGYSHKDFLLKRFPSFCLIGEGFLREEVTTHVMSLTTIGLRHDLEKGGKL